MNASSTTDYTLESYIDIADDHDRTNNIWTCEVIAPDGTVVTRIRAIGEHEARKRGGAMRDYCIANGHAHVESPSAR